MNCQLEYYKSYAKFVEVDTYKLLPELINIDMNTNKEEFRKPGSFSFKDSISYSENAVVSKQVLKKTTGNITLFAFDKDQELSEHTAPFDALVQVLEGDVRITINNTDYMLSEGFSIIMPANSPHALYAVKRFKMLLTMIKS
jgi:quercetin dioxygenase-like cupin family protein